VVLFYLTNGVYQTQQAVRAVRDDKAGFRRGNMQEVLQQVGKAIAANDVCCVRHRVSSAVINREVLLVAMSRKQAPSAC